jgi:FkbM family methyltransferase
MKAILKAGIRHILAHRKMRWISQELLRTEGTYLCKRCDEHVFVFYPADMIGEMLQTRGEYQRDIVAKVAPLLPQTPLTILELGANIGTQTVYFFDYLNVQGVIAVEPEPENVDLLNMNVLLNGLSDKVSVVAKAVSSRPGMLEFAKFHVNSARSAVVSPSIIEEGRQTDHTVLRVPADTADNICPSPDFVWIDVEEHEIEVLKGMRGIIERKVPMLIEISRQALSDADFAYFVDEVLPHYSRMRAYETGFADITPLELRSQQYNLLLT